MCVNELTQKQRERIVHLVREGLSFRSIERITGHRRETISRYARDADDGKRTITTARRIIAPETRECMQTRIIAKSQIYPSERSRWAHSTARRCATVPATRLRSTVVSRERVLQPIQHPIEGCGKRAEFVLAFGWEMQPARDRRTSDDGCILDHRAGQRKT